MKKIILSLVSFGLAACGMTTLQHYPGPAKTNNEVAILSMWLDNPDYKGDFYPADLKVSSHSINGELLQSNEQIAVLPGEYSFKVKCDYKGAVKYHTYQIRAEAGKNYAVLVYAKENECQFQKLNLLINNERFEEL
ncbi:hypothetical protein Rhein_1831 [Rheinheimera sp. A13L]|uniref:hypothetical protein n=1 Tax=Rheinheimera sp. A13L TaxID=506534 RepID=UPI0002124EB1|nr:hypothetical protein [Rheinheimera sp. A13L]EGM78014.1 hypothetical protein Rhein_1831 [Rheinheimera sp. A13L]